MTRAPDVPRRGQWFVQTDDASWLSVLARYPLHDLARNLRTPAKPFGLILVSATDSDTVTYGWLHTVMVAGSGADERGSAAPCVCEQAVLDLVALASAHVLAAISARLRVSW